MPKSYSAAPTAICSLRSLTGPILARNGYELPQQKFVSPTSIYNIFNIKFVSQEAAAVVSHLSDIFGPMQPKKKDDEKLESEDSTAEEMEVDEPKCDEAMPVAGGETKTVDDIIQQVSAEAASQEFAQPVTKEEEVGSAMAADGLVSSSSPPRSKHPSSSSKLQVRVHIFRASSDQVSDRMFCFMFSGPAG